MAWCGLALHAVPLKISDRKGLDSWGWNLSRAPGEKFFSEHRPTTLPEASLLIVTMGRNTDSSSRNKRKAPYEGKDGVKKSRNDYQKSTFTKHRSSDNNTDGGAKLNVNGYQGEKDSKNANGVGKPSETG